MELENYKNNLEDKYIKLNKESISKIIQKAIEILNLKK